MVEMRHYIMFPSYTEGMKMDSVLKKEKIKYTIVPTPRELSTSCGISVIYNKEDEDRIKELIYIRGVKISGMQSITREIKNYYLK